MHIKLYVVLFFVFANNFLFAQGEVDTFFVSFTDKQIERDSFLNENISNQYVLFQEANSNSFPLKDWSFSKGQELEVNSIKRTSHQSYKSRLVLKNDTEEERELYYIFERNDFIDLYEESKEGGANFIQTCGFLQERQNKKAPMSYYRFRMSPGEEKVFVAHYYKIRSVSYDFKASIFDEKNFLVLEIEKMWFSKKKAIWHFSFMIFILALSSGAFARYFYNERKEYFWYGCYTFLMFISSWIVYERVTWEPYLFGHIPECLTYGTVISNILPIIFFLFFLDRIMKEECFEVNLHLPLIIKISISFYLICSFSITVLQNGILQRVFSRFYTYGVFFPYGFLIAYSFWESKKKLFRIIAIGISTAIFLTIIAFVVKWLQEENVIGLDINSNAIMSLGIAIEVICFNIALGYRSRQVDIRADKSKRQLIDKLQENAALKDRLNKSLNDEVLEKTKALEEEQKAKIHAQFEKLIAKTKMKALKAQMNPHFLFNALNSVRGLIARKEMNSAMNYLSEFSVLLRKTLEYSEKKAISLAEEIELLETYISLEQLRNSNFEFLFKNETNLNLDEIKIPPLFLQIFVENAIKHAFKKENGLLQINISENHTGFLISIIDNGQGFDYLKINNNHSFGLKIAHDRAENFSVISEHKIIINILNLTNISSQGTQVDICFIKKMNVN